MSMINKIIKTLKEFKEINDYKIIETNTKTIEQFYDLGKLETMRETNVSEVNVTIYIVKEVEDNKKIASSSFIVSHELSKKDLINKINEAIFSSSFIANDFYELVKGDKKKSYKQIEEEINPIILLQNIAKTYFNQVTDNCSFNALELFFNDLEIHLINSQGVDYKKKSHNIKIEAIPSYKDDTFKTELYRMFEYDIYDLKKIEEDSQNALKDCLMRAKAVKNEQKICTNVILKDVNVKSLFFELISNYDYGSVYKKASNKKIGDYITNNTINPLCLSLAPASKATFFDGDGVLLEKVEIIKDNQLVDYYGSSRYAYYLDKKPNGMLPKLVIKKGKTSVEKMKKNPYIEIIDLSGIQIDVYANYIGGEVRLANYFDGNNFYPISGFSFSGNLQECVDKMTLSNELVTIKNYTGPKYVMLKDIEVM